MPYGRRPRLYRLDRLIIGASPEKLSNAAEVPAADGHALTEEQQQELYRLQYKQRKSTLSPAEACTLHRLISIARGRK